MKKVLNITGMTCKSCVMLIESELKELDGVNKAKVKLADDAVGVDFNEEKIDLEKIKKTISELGYGVDGKKPSGHAAKNDKTFLQGLAYGIMPHIGCIAFIIASVLGATVMMNVFRPLLMSRYIFHALIGLSILFAGISSAIYLRNNDLLSWKGIKKKKGYLATMFGSTIGINLVLFFVIFPMVAAGSARGVDQGYVNELAGSGNLGTTSMTVDIPCPGHAPLITNELKTIDGVIDVQFSFPDQFDVRFDAEKATVDDMMALEVFDEYPATLLEEGSGTVETAAFAQSFQGERGGSAPSGGYGCGGGGTCGI